MAVRSITSDLENGIKRDQNIYGGRHCKREEGSELGSFTMRALIRNSSNPAKFSENQFANCNYYLPRRGGAHWRSIAERHVLLQLRYSSRRMPNPRNLTELCIMIDSVHDSVRAKNDLANAIIPIFGHDATQLWKFM